MRGVHLPTYPGGLVCRSCQSTERPCQVQESCPTDISGVHRIGTRGLTFTRPLAPLYGPQSVVVSPMPLYDRDADSAATVGASWSPVEERFSYTPTLTSSFAQLATSLLRARCWAQWAARAARWKSQISSAIGHIFILKSLQHLTHRRARQRALTRSRGLGVNNGQH